MRWFALVGLVGLLSGCGPESVDETTPAPAPAVETEKTQSGPPESWCRSYKTQRYCPSVCVWYSYPAPGYCGVAAES